MSTTTPSDDQGPVESPAYAAAVVVPDVSTVKLFGVLNIVFASILLLCGGCFSLQTAAQMIFSPMAMEMSPAGMRAGQDAARAQRTAELEEQQAVAETEEEKLAFQAELQQLESDPPSPPDFSNMWGGNDPLIWGYFVVDLASGMILNLLMLVSGIGLVTLKPWGRRLAVWLAGVKIVRLALLCVVVVLFVAPAFGRAMAQTMEEMMAYTQQMGPAGGGGPKPQIGAEMGAMYGTMMAGYGIAALVLGSIYPAIMLWFLTRPQAKAACGSHVVQRNLRSDP